MKPKLDLSKIAKALGAKRRGKVVAHGGYFGAMQRDRSAKPGGSTLYDVME